jgi:hypothetical protein
MGSQTFTSPEAAVPAVTGENTGGGFGVSGVSDTGIGVNGKCSTSSPGVQGVSDTGHGVHGESRTNHAVHGESAAGRGVVGISQTFVGVTGESTSNDGVLGTSISGVGVHGKGGQLAGLFQGDVKIEGKILAPGGDLEQRIAQLERQVVTNFGAPITSPVTRPNLTVVRQLRRDELAADEPPGAHLFEVQGRDFLHRTTVSFAFSIAQVWISMVLKGRGSLLVDIQSSPKEMDRFSLGESKSVVGQGTGCKLRLATAVAI